MTRHPLTHMPRRRATDEDDATMDRHFKRSMTLAALLFVAALVLLTIY